MTPSNKKYPNGRFKFVLEFTLITQEMKRQGLIESQQRGFYSLPSTTDVEQTDKDETDTFNDEIRNQVEKINQATTQKVKEYLSTMCPYKFEHLVGEVLKKCVCAYSVETTPRSRDNGIDGYLYFDPLGLNSAIFQVKRYNNKNIERSDLDAFATRFRHSGSNNAIFITLSSYSKGAISCAEISGIRLIDGDELIQRMAETGVGLRQAHVVYDIDPLLLK